MKVGADAERYQQTSGQEAQADQPPSPRPGGERGRVRGDRRIGTARALRRRSTDAETKLWARLRNRQLDGLKFKRQFTIGQYVADFACPEHHLVVEVDGEQHGFDTNTRQDAERTARLEAMGYVVLRFWNLDVHRNMDGVLTDILHQLNRLDPAIRHPEKGPEPPHPIPLPAGERGPGVKVGAGPEPSEITLGLETRADESTSPRPGGGAIGRPRSRTASNKPHPVRDKPNA